MYFKEPLKSDLVDALRSGNYFQITSQLTTGLVNGERGCCCLGVACDVVDPDGWKDKFFAYKGDTDAESLPKSFAADFVLDDNGLPVETETAFVFNKEQQVAAVEMFFENGQDDRIQPFSLTTLNDAYEIPFPLLADFIEAHC